MNIVYMHNKKKKKRQDAYTKDERIQTTTSESNLAAMQNSA